MWRIYGCCFALPRSSLQSQSTIPWKMGISATPLKLYSSLEIALDFRKLSQAWLHPLPLVCDQYRATNAPPIVSVWNITLKSHPGSSGPIERAEALLTTYRGSSSLFPVRPASVCDYRCKSEGLPQSTVITESIYRKPDN